KSPRVFGKSKLNCNSFVASSRCNESPLDSSFQRRPKALAGNRNVEPGMEARFHARPHVSKTSAKYKSTGFSQTQNCHRRPHRRRMTLPPSRKLAYSQAQEVRHRALPNPWLGREPVRGQGISQRGTANVSSRPARHLELS